MPGAVIVDAIRTPIGRAAKGSLKDVRADDLAAAPLRALVERNPEVDFAQTVDVMLGCGFAMGEAGYNVGRNAALLAGLDHHVPATNRQPLLRILVADTADGLSRERPARATNSCRRRRSGQPLPAHPPFDPHPRLSGGDGAPYDVYIPMRLTAENVARRCQVSREVQDEWAKLSQNRARRRPLRRRDRGGRRRHARRSPAPRHDAGEARRAQAGLRPRARTVTAGNSCPLNDGAAAILVMSEKEAAALSVKPRARIVASSVAAIRPEIMGLGPIPAVKGVLEQAAMTIEDIDIVELNEAFTAQVVPCRDELSIDPGKLNPFGGAIALGHVRDDRRAHHDHAAQRLDATDGTLGLETRCVAGGMGMAMIVERLI